MSEHHVSITFTLNDQRVELVADAGKPLADLLREDLDETSVQLGCRNGDCGSCTILLDGASIKSCMMPSGRAAGHAIETLQGLAADGTLHPVQEAFWQENGFQCGFCLPGQVLCTVELLRTTAEPAPGEIANALQGNLCRCTGYQNIMTAAARAARTVAVQLET